MVAIYVAEGVVSVGSLTTKCIIFVVNAKNRFKSSAYLYVFVSPQSQICLVKDVLYGCGNSVDLHCAKWLRVTILSRIMMASEDDVHIVICTSFSILKSIHESFHYCIVTLGVFQN